MSPLVFTVRPPLPPGAFIAIHPATVITCGTRDIAATYDPNLANRICLLLNEFGLELGVEETEAAR